MAFDEGLAVRIEEALVDVPNVEQKKMFGGIAFMVRQHMCVGVIDDMLMARVGPKQYADCLKEEHVREMNFTGKPLTGMVYVAPEGIEESHQLSAWVETCLAFIATLPDKKPKARKKKKKAR